MKLYEYLITYEKFNKIHTVEEFREITIASTAKDAWEKLAKGKGEIRLIDIKRIN